MFFSKHWKTGQVLCLMTLNTGKRFAAMLSLTHNPADAFSTAGHVVNHANHVHSFLDLTMVNLTHSLNVFILFTIFTGLLHLIALSQDLWIF